MVWASGTEGTVLRTVDAGRTVTSVGPADTDAIQFRDIEATSARHAVIMGIGDTPDAFRFYVTDDGGRHWRLAYQNADPAAFYDCMAFTSPRVGYAMSDPIRGKFRILRTTDAGHSWRLMSAKGMPAAKDGEFGFAASGTCLQTDRKGDLFLGSGGVDPARIFRSTDRGRTWTVQDSPVAGAAAGGIFSISFGWGRGGVAVGGDYTDPTAAKANGAWTSNLGRTWHPAKGLGGYRSGSAWVHDGASTVLAVGPTGSDVSTNGGRSYTTFDTGTFDSVDCVAGHCFASGDLGRLAVLRTTTPHR
ncbi:Oxidoreductase [Nostocoides japonicum T1-X7]|uniref:Oxidoreductase n=1 Tax=Nostocoides japonicum T1-X7 TaxID=1194083 RepID=A0A077LU04_9MICO|nr:Oxidoreductase [Tetrasphaera japonica T1-X7]